MVTDVCPDTSSARAREQSSVAWPRAVQHRGSAAVHCSRRCVARVAAVLQPQPSRHRRIRAEMGYAGLMRFEPDELALLDETEEIEIETARPGRRRPSDDHLGRRRRRRRLRPFGQRRERALVPRGDRQPGGHDPRRRPARCRRAPMAAADADSIERTSATRSTRKYAGIPGLATDARARHLRHDAAGSSPPDDRRPAPPRRLEPRPHVLRRVQAPAARHRPGRDRGLAHVARPGRRRRKARRAPGSSSTSCSSAPASSRSGCRR